VLLIQAASSSLVIDIAKYSVDPALEGSQCTPITREETTQSGYRELVAACRSQLNARGYVHLSNFVFEPMAMAMAQEAIHLVAQPNKLNNNQPTGEPARHVQVIRGA